MARVEAWFDDFTDSLMARVRRSDWPDAASEYWAEMRRSLVKHGATGAVATEAVSELVESPPAFLGEVIPALIGAIRAVFRRARPAPPSPTASLIRAEAASNADFDARAEANWEALDEPEREGWRDLVRERLPEMARRPGWLEGLAKGWALDDAMIANPPPPPRGETRLPAGVRKFAWSPYSNPPKPAGDAGKGS